jgi:hypothetical protein
MEVSWDTNMIWMYCKHASGSTCLLYTFSSNSIVFFVRSTSKILCYYQMDIYLEKAFLPVNKGLCKLLTKLNNSVILIDDCPLIAHVTCTTTHLAFCYTFLWCHYLFLHKWSCVLILCWYGLIKSCVLILCWNYGYIDLSYTFILSLVSFCW